jgi:hypothetical protein
MVEILWRSMAQGIWIQQVFATWLSRLLSDERGTVCADDVDRQQISPFKNLMFHDRTKHIATRFHFIRECVE